MYEYLKKLLLLHCTRVIIIEETTPIMLYDYYMINEKCIKMYKKYIFASKRKWFCGLIALWPINSSHQTWIYWEIRINN